MFGWFRVFRSQKLQIGLCGLNLAVFEIGGQQIENAANKGNNGKGSMRFFAAADQPASFICYRCIVARNTPV